MFLVPRQLQKGKPEAGEPSVFGSASRGEANVVSAARNTKIEQS